MRSVKIIGVVLLACGTSGCVGSALPPGTLVSGPPPVYAPPPPRPYYGYPPPPPVRCYDRPGFYGPEQVCRPVY